MSDILGLKSWAIKMQVRKWRQWHEAACVLKIHQFGNSGNRWFNCWSVHRFSGMILPVRCVFGWVETLETLNACNVKRRSETQEILSFAADALP